MTKARCQLTVIAATDLVNINVRTMLEMLSCITDAATKNKHMGRVVHDT